MSLFSRVQAPFLRRGALWALIGGLALAPAAGATVIQVTSPADLSANDAIAWRQTVTNGVNAAYIAPVGVVSNNGVGAVVSNVSGPEHSLVFSTGIAAASIFDPNSGDPNDDLLSNCCAFRPPFTAGDITINFASPVRGVGAFVLGTAVNYSVNLRVNGTSSFSVGGNFSPADRTHYPFLGVLSDAMDIYSITFTSTSDGELSGLLSMDNLRLNTTAPPPPFSAAPEPSTWAMFIGGFGLAGGALRRRRSVAHAWAGRAGASRL